MLEYLYLGLAVLCILALVYVMAGAAGEER